MENPMMGKAQEMIYGEIGDFADSMMVGDAPDLTVNRAKPENMPGIDPADPGVTFSEEEMGMLETAYGARADSNY